MKYNKYSNIIGIYISALSLLFLIYTSCNNSTSKANTAIAIGPKAERKESLIELLIGNSDKVFRSVNLGADSKTVLNSEKKIPDENDTDDISYTLPMDTLQPDSVNEPIDSVSYFKITYYFDKGKLNEVEEDIYMESDSLAANLLERFTDYFGLKYGNYASRNDSRVWEITHGGKKDWVSLGDQSEEYNSGKLLLVFYSEQY